MDISLPKEKVVPQLWSAYTKTQEYKEGQTEAIPPHHKLLEDQERLGLKAIYERKILKLLKNNSNLKDDFQQRTIGDWLKEWKKMHLLLFERILKNCGDLRKEDVRFGNPGEEELYRIPSHQNVGAEINQFARQIQEIIDNIYRNDPFKILATVHFQFVRIHPFYDGNGRIARALTDQIALYLGYPPAMGGYPRHAEKQRIAYHQAIRSCVDNPEYTKLASWIRSYIDKQLAEIA